MALVQAELAYVGIFKSNVSFDYAQRLKDYQCERKARSNLQLTKPEIASSYHSSQWQNWLVGMWATVMN